MMCGRDTLKKSWLGSLAARFAIFAIVLQLLALPVCCIKNGEAAAASTVPGAHFITICSGLNHKVILVDADNQPLQAQPAGSANGHCPLCTIAAGSMLIAVALALLGPVARRRRPAPRPVSTLLSASRFIVWPTGLSPPVLSLR
jgi:hypothetical protein